MSPILRRFIGGFICSWLIAMPSSSLATEVVSFRLSQVSVVTPDITAYLEILDGDGYKAENILSDQVNASIGSQQAIVGDLTDFSKSGAGTGLIMLIDISNSLTEREFSQMRTVLKTWINAMSGKDKTAIMTFGKDVKLVRDFTANKEILREIVEDLKPTDNQTQLHSGLVQAMELGRRSDLDLPLRRAIITLTDGEDDFPGGMTKQEVLDRMRIDPVPIYAVGFYQPPKTFRKEGFLRILGEFARTSGGAYFRAEANNLPEIFSKTRKKIQDVYELELTCKDCNWDGTPRRLQVALSSGSKILNAGMDIRLFAKTEKKPETVASESTEEERQSSQTGMESPGTEQTSGNPIQVMEKNETIEKESDVEDKFPLTWWLLLVVGVGVLCIVILMLVVRRKRRLREPSVSGSFVSKADPNEAIPVIDLAVVKDGIAAKTLPPGPTVPPVPPPSDKRLKFTVIRGSSRVPIEKDLCDRLVIGRSNNCDIVLAEDKGIPSQRAAWNSPMVLNL
ncbi:MAG: VWA domain-containing protein [Desulfotomaculaceae bacterium]|nr:VWA domain-containing protein [Desulfotomaculaceae bacterium]